MQRGEERKDLIGVDCEYRFPPEKNVKLYTESDYFGNKFFGDVDS